MKLYNIKHNDEQVSFSQAVRQGLGRNQGLFFPSDIPDMGDIDALLAEDFVSRSSKILSALIGDELESAKVAELVDNAFQFPAPIKQVKDGTYALELFHGPTLAFKDFGGRFMAQSLATVSDGGKITILTATSGDTGAAVAHAFYGMEDINVVILYPKGKISRYKRSFSVL
ncbi:threonine synthase [Vibrio sp. JCM 19236]|nr:threonine synthase [Vibrio sp. JCM 19236]